MKFFRIVIGVCLIGLVGACATPRSDYVDERLGLKEACLFFLCEKKKPTVKVSKDKFRANLYKEYVKLAKAEANGGDWRSARYFSDKAISAANGSEGPDTGSLDIGKTGNDSGNKINGVIGPDLPVSRHWTWVEWLVRPVNRDWSNRGYSNDKKVQPAYDKLVKALKSGAPKANPKACAQAQVAYDSWLEEKEECVDPKAIKKAWKKYTTAMKKCVPGQPFAPRTFIVFFDFDSSKLTAGAKRILDAATKYAKKGKKVKLVLTGHADTSGNPKYNEGLSLRRANSVWSGLVDRGLSAKSMKVHAKGESDPLITSGDGVKEPQNRRVHIDLK
jgi:outer membrane protein OmpA-like peptidoglycan-associated protein